MHTKASSIISHVSCLCATFMRVGNLAQCSTPDPSLFIPQCELIRNGCRHQLVDAAQYQCDKVSHASCIFRVHSCSGVPTRLKSNEIIKCISCKATRQAHADRVQWLARTRANSCLAAGQGKTAVCRSRGPASCVSLAISIFRVHSCSGVPTRLKSNEIIKCISCKATRQAHADGTVACPHTCQLMSRCWTRQDSRVPQQGAGILRQPCHQVPQAKAM